MRYLYSRIPAAAVFTEIDGNAYARIPHKLASDGSRIVETYDAPIMVRFESPSHIRNGEAYVLFARVGDGIDLGHIPFSVTTEQRDDSGRVAPYTRAQMMAEPYTTPNAATARHRRYYAQFVSPSVLRLVASHIGRERIIASSRGPREAFNDIPLHQWDRIESSIRNLCLSRMGDVNGRTAGGGIAWSLSDAVCIAKEAARQIAESADETSERAAEIRADYGLMPEPRA